jgi:hypothetical protein
LGSAAVGVCCEAITLPHASELAGSERVRSESSQNGREPLALDRYDLNP